MEMSQDDYDVAYREMLEATGISPALADRIVRGRPATCAEDIVEAWARGRQVWCNACECGNKGGVHADLYVTQRWQDYCLSIWHKGNDEFPLVIWDDHKQEWMENLTDGTYHDEDYIADEFACVVILAD